MPKPESMSLPPTQVTPEPALEKRTRRQLTLEYKLWIIAEADRCQRGELGALLPSSTAQHKTSRHHR